MAPVLIRHVLEFSAEPAPTGPRSSPAEDRDAVEHHFVAVVELPSLDGLGPTADGGAAEADAEPDTEPDASPETRPDTPRAARPAAIRSRLHIGGIATWSELRVNGALVRESRSMFAADVLDVTEHLREGRNTVQVRVLPLTDLLAATPRRPRARWRTAVVEDNRLRWVRTTLLGRCPGFAPGPPVVGPWRPIVLELYRGPVLVAADVRAVLTGDDGVVRVHAELSEPAPVTVEISGPHATVSRTLEAGEQSIEITLPQVQRWWPWTHGAPTRYAVRLLVGTHALEWPGDGTAADRTVRHVGFRTLSAAAPGEPVDVEHSGIALHVNGVPVFCRGAVWVPRLTDPRPEASLGDLDSMVAMNLNMVRVPGLAWYESDAFHDRCDELGILVWQDLMFATLDVPVTQQPLRDEVTAEIGAQLRRLGSRPSLTVVCGSSELRQQAAMMGALPQAEGEQVDDELVALASAALRSEAVDAIWVPSAPCGGDLPFRTDVGIANYYGVGGYRRPLSDVRIADVRFAAECLALANLPDGPLGVAFDARWKAGVPRDSGSPWDFDDVREHYLAELFGPSAPGLRLSDPDRWVELSRAVSGEVMAHVFGDWRRQASPSGGGLVLWLRDLLPGAGWGLLDAGGNRKSASWPLARVLAPVAVWATDEGLNGVDVHLANDTPAALNATLELRLWRDGEVLVGSVDHAVELAAHSVTRLGVESLLARFTDAGYAYRFGPPAQDAISARLRAPDGSVLAEHTHFPVARGLGRLSAEDCALTAEVRLDSDGTRVLTLTTQRVLWAVRVSAGAAVPSDDALTLVPGLARQIRFDSAGGPVSGEVTAANLEGRLTFTG